MRALILDPIASTLSSASSMFARRAVSLSEGFDWTDVENPNSEQMIRNKRVLEQTIGAAIVSIASLEGMVNEILVGSANSRRDPVGAVEKHAYQRWGRMWERGAFSRLTILDKCQVALEIADMEPLPTESGPVQDVTKLIALRNELVHSEPKFRPQGSDVPQRELDSLEKRLRGRFQENQLVHRRAPFIWQRCLGAGCAKWCVETEISFQNSFFAALGINIQAQIDWNSNFSDLA